MWGSKGKKFLKSKKQISQYLSLILILVLITPIQNLAHATLTFTKINLPSLGAANISAVNQSRDGTTIV